MLSMKHSRDNLIDHVDLEPTAVSFLQSDYEAVYEIENDPIIVDYQTAQHKEKETAPFREQNGLFFCNRCSKKYTSERYIRLHIQSTH